MKFHLKRLENFLIQCKTNVLNYYNWKGISEKKKLILYYFAVKYKISKLSFSNIYTNTHRI